MLKYIVIPHNDLEAMITFPDIIEHDIFSSACCIDKANIISAGFINKDLECYGYSHSLGITSRGLVDTKLLRFNLGKQNG
jgi:hypothetical protein